MREFFCNLKHVQFKTCNLKHVHTYNCIREEIYTYVGFSYASLHSLLIYTKQTEESYFQHEYVLNVSSRDRKFRTICFV